MKASIPRHSRTVLVVAAVMLLAFLTACSKQPPTDAQIIGDVVTRIHSSQQVTKKDIAVSSQNGVVTLRGTVPSDEERSMAATLASQTPGVKTVINDLFIDAPATSEAEQASTDPEIAQTETAAEPEPVRPAPRARASKPSAYSKRTEQPKSAKVTSTPARATATTSNMPIVVENSTPVQSSQVATVPALPSIPSTPAVKPVQVVRVGSGTELSVRLTDSIDSDRNQPGDSFRGTLDSPIYVDGQLVVPRGASVMGKVTDVQDSGRFTGRPQLAIELTSLAVNGRSYSIQTNQYTKQGSSQGSRTAKTVGSGAAIGAIIGAIAGGGKGAAIGAAVGAGAGGGVQAARGSQKIHLGSETRLSFRLENPISVVPASDIDRGSNNNYQSSASIFDQDQQSSNDTYDDTYQAPEPVDTPDGDRPVLKRRPVPSNRPN